jgi:FKBP-type peptidyl-prolyl cis-trans isomerase FkpA
MRPSFLLPLLLALGACGEVQSGGTIEAIRAPDLPEQPIVPELVDYHADLDVTIAEMKQLTSGLLYADDSVGTGDSVVVGSNVSVLYTGWFPDGTPFDSNRESGQPYAFQVGRGEVIEAWDEGLLGMRVGGRRKLVVPPALGYGEAGFGPIPSNAILVFAIELVEIRP